MTPKATISKQKRIPVINGYLLILPIFRVISILSNIKQKE